jgi:hypothetical protein
MRDLVSLLRDIPWLYTQCGARVSNVHVRWGYNGMWCDRCWRQPPAHQALEWYTLADVVSANLLYGFGHVNLQKSGHRLRIAPGVSRAFRIESSAISHTR